MSSEEIDAGLAPSLGDCLSNHYIPRHMHDNAERAMKEWLHSWRGLNETAESLYEQIERGR